MHNLPPLQYKSDFIFQFLIVETFSNFTIDIAVNKADNHKAIEMPLPLKRKCVRPTTSYLDLNDDVLREIFRNLDADDLCAVADLCSSFKRNAQAEFAQRYKDLRFDTDQHAADYVYDADNISNRCNSANTIRFQLKRMALILRNFGLSLTSLDIDLPLELRKRNQSQHVIEMVSIYCGESLKELKLSNLEFSVETVRIMQPLLSGVQVLKLSCIWFDKNAAASEMLSFCSDLRTLEFSAMPPMNTNTLAVFPRDFVIILELADALTVYVIQSFVENTPLIEHIKIRVPSFPENTEHLEYLTALKTLRINCDGASFAPQLKELAAAHISLECLDLTNCRSNRELVNELLDWKQLQKLGLEFDEWNIKFSDILTIVRNLGELTELRLTYFINRMFPKNFAKIVHFGPKLRKIHIDKQSYSGIVCIPHFAADFFTEIRDAVTNRKDKCPLVLCFYGYADNGPLNVPKEFLNADESAIFKVKFFEEIL